MQCLLVKLSQTPNPGLNCKIQALASRSHTFVHELCAMGIFLNSLWNISARMSWNRAGVTSLEFCAIWRKEAGLRRKAFLRQALRFLLNCPGLDSSLTSNPRIPRILALSIRAGSTLRMPPACQSRDREEPPPSQGSPQPVPTCALWVCARLPLQPLSLCHSGRSSTQPSLMFALSVSAGGRSCHS